MHFRLEVRERGWWHTVLFYRHKMVGYNFRDGSGGRGGAVGEDYHISREEGGGTVYIKRMSKEEGLFNKSKCEMKISAHTSQVCSQR